MMERAKLRRGLQIFIQLQQLRNLEDLKLKEYFAGLGKSSKALIDMVLLKHCLMF